MGTVWVDPGVVSFDPEDGDLTDKIERDTSELNTNVPGVYRVTYTVTDAAGCEITAARFIRVVALVATSDPLYLRQLCLRQVPTATAACEGMHMHGSDLPNPSAFPACCLVVSEMDAAACFCDGAVIGEFNKHSAEFFDAATFGNGTQVATVTPTTPTTFFDAIRTFTPLACGFQLKTGQVCTDARVLQKFLVNETMEALEEDEADEESQIVSFEEIISSGGALDTNLPCADQIKTARALCGRLTRGTRGGGSDSRQSSVNQVTAYVPCCAAVAQLNASKCLCEANELKGSQNFERFLTRLVGFAPLGCGFALTGSCPGVVESVFELPEVFTEVMETIIPSVRPVAFVDNQWDEAWRFLSPPSEGDEIATEVPEEWGSEESQVLIPMPPSESPLPPATTETYQEQEIIMRWQNGETTRIYEWTTCDAYVTYAAEACDSLRVDADVSVFEVTDCCAVLKAARARGCMCPPLGSSRFSQSNPDLPVIVPTACGFHWEEFPQGDDTATCRTQLTLAEVLAPAAATWTREKGDSDEATDESGTESESSAFFNDRDVTFDSLAAVAEKATPIVVTDPAKLVITSNDAETQNSYVLPPGSVIGSIAPDALGDSNTNTLGDDSDGPDTLQPGVTYVVSKETLMVSEVTSNEDVENPVLVAIVVGDLSEENGIVVVTTPDPTNAVTVPWEVSLTPVPLVSDAPAVDSNRATIPSVVITRAPDGTATLVPVPPKEDRDADPSLTASFADQVAELEGSDSLSRRNAGGLVYANEDDVTGIESTTPGSTTTCLRAILLAESSCIPVLERVVDMFELDLTWRQCCGRIAAVADAGCYCNGAAVLALEQTSRADVHFRVVEAVKGACGIDVTPESREDCPTARFEPVDTEQRDAVDVVTSVSAEQSTNENFDENLSPGTTLVAVDGGLYQSDPEIVSMVTGSGGVHVARSTPRTMIDYVPTDPVTRPLPVLAVEPQPETDGVFVEADGSVVYQNRDLPGVTFTIDDTRSDVDGVTVLSRNGTASRVRLDGQEDGQDNTGDVAEALFSVLPTGAFDVQFNDKETDVTLTDGDDAARRLTDDLQLDARYDPADEKVVVTLPDGVVVTARRGKSNQEVLTVTPDTDELEDVYAGPSTGSVGVVTRDGAVVAPPVDGEPEGVCSGIRELKNFLSTNMEPGAKEFTVVGAVSCCSPTNITTPELVVPVRYLPRGGDSVDTFAPPLSKPETRCLGVRVVDVNGRFGPDMCDQVTFEQTAYGVDVIIKNVDVCVDCSLTGRISDGAMFKVSHENSDTLLAMRPTIDRLECDVDRAEAILAEIEEGASTVERSTPEVTRPTDERSGGRALLQFLSPEILPKVTAFSETSEVDDFWNRLAAETGVAGQPDQISKSRSDDSPATEFGTDERGGRYGLVEDTQRTDTNGGQYDDSEEIPEITFDNVQPEIDLSGDGDIIIGCDDDVTRLGNDVQWWSRGAGPLEPGLPNEPYDEYVFAGSVDVLSEDSSSEMSLPQNSNSVRLVGIVLPVVFSPWVLDTDSSGDWRAVLDPTNELEVACAGASTRLPNGTVVPRPETCGGLGFALSLFQPPDDDSSEPISTDENQPPAVILLEVTFSGELCPGCRFQGGGVKGEMFRVRHKDGASLDFVGPTVGALECAPGGPVGQMVERVVVDRFDAATGVSEELEDDAWMDAESDSAVDSTDSTGDSADSSTDDSTTPTPTSPTSEPIVGFMAQGSDRDVSDCDGKKGLNLKGELLNDGGSLIKGAASDCCWECTQTPECNVWVYCEGDCGEYAFHSCWLKRAVVASADDTPDAWTANPNVPWTSGAFPPKQGADLVEKPAVETDAETPEEDTDSWDGWSESPVDVADVVGGPPSATPTVTPTTTPTTAPSTTPSSTPVPTPTPQFTEPPNIRVVPIGATPTPRAAPETAPETTPEPTPETTAETTAETTPDTSDSVTLVPGEPTEIPGSVITLLPDEQDNVGDAPATPEGPTTPTTPTTPSRPTPAPSTSCDSDSVPVCPPDLTADTITDPLAAANIRGSFQLLRKRSDDPSDDDSSLTLLRPNDLAKEIFVTGTLINAQRDETLCLSNLQIEFDFPRTVVVDGASQVVDTPDFVVTCFYVGVRSRSASAAPSSASSDPQTIDSNLRPTRPAPASCTDVVSLDMTSSGPVMAFNNDTALCPGCWLVGGRDGVLFSVRHKDDLQMTARGGDAVGFKGATCE